MEGIMKPVSRGFWQKSNKWLKTGWLITAGLSALYFGTTQLNQGYRGIAAEKSTGLSADQWGTCFDVARIPSGASLQGEGKPAGRSGQVDCGRWERGTVAAGGDGQLLAGFGVARS